MIITIADYNQSDFFNPLITISLLSFSFLHTIYGMHKRNYEKCAIIIFNIVDRNMKFYMQVDHEWFIKRSF